MPLYSGRRAAVRGARFNLPSVLERQQGELLRTSSEPDFRGVQVPLAVDGDVVHPLELARHAAGAAEGGELTAARALERVDAPVRAVGDIQVLLRRIVRKHHIPHRAVRARQRLDAELLDELAARLEHLDAV